MTVDTTAGAALYIGGVKNQKTTNFVASDFTGQTWVEIGEIESLGSLGDTSEAVSFTALKNPRTRVLKGPRSAGTMDVVCGLDDGDVGQDAARDAEASKRDYAFKIVFEDAPEDGTPGMRYFIAKVMTQTETYDAANSVRKLNLSLGINSNVVRVVAAD